ncbi:glycoside hydrolase family 95 protein [Marinilabilia salmonicolor]|uniref:Alpha-L-fucosidase 2 n=1 Tax=Marinilabilia salmonicolor TaxID=989 RepID=A0A2T0XCI7_9BACT|nr:glycoside hydrolase family 95 protein [Marinilabilia salmonicolor]PRY96650.1 alpha-L-fucosidase 2 [Marinilabilia salmonicolor]RCW33271.1 alpha-L-fucosidase 2 [Marinilabilia salmonicolor]
MQSIMNSLRKILIIAFSFLLLGACTKDTPQESDLKLWYDKPAENWNEALPVGNGRLGAMVFGDPANENIQLNEETFWSGGPSRNDNPKALEALPKVRKLIFNGQYHEAEKMINENMVAEQLHGSMYQTIGNLNLTFEGHENYSNYYRELNIEKALHTTSYTVDDVNFKREIFASFPDQIIVVKLSADRPESLSFTANLIGPLAKNTKAVDASTLEMTGISGTHEGVEGKVEFNTLAKILNTDGATSADGDKITVKNASEVVILISMATNFVDYKTLTADENEKCRKFLTAAQTKAYSEIKEAHIRDYRKYFTRSSLDLGTTPAIQRPTDVRIKNFSQTNDPALVSLYYQFGRYLLISSSRPGGQPANLQGIWNGSTNPAWDSKYTININTEMNYWPAEKTNLPELHEPLIEMVRELSEAGSQTAQNMYGCNGWVTHHNTDIWRITGVVDGAFWGMWPMGGAWLTQHLWEKYLYSGDQEYLASVYPIMKSACRFYQDFLVEEPSNGWLVVSPSNSPENAPAGRPSVTAGATMDNQILFDLFTKTKKAAILLNEDEKLINDFQKIIDRLPPMQIGKHGQLQEWMEDLDSPDDKHRHISHLYGLHPSNQISPYSSPELFEAARTTLKHRGDVSTGWSMGWKVNFWARMLDGNHAMKLIQDQLTLVGTDNNSGEGGGTYPNLLDAHPPFQIDGNFGCAVGIAEMLLQSHDGAIHFLPALPDDWQNGEITGLRTPGGFEVSFKWSNGHLIKAEIKSTLGGNCRIRVPNEMKISGNITLEGAKEENPNPFFEKPQIKTPLISEKAPQKAVSLPETFLYDFKTEKNQVYSLRIK